MQEMAGFSSAAQADVIYSMTRGTIMKTQFYTRVMTVIVASQVIRNCVIIVTL